MSSKQMSFDEQLNAYMVQIGCTNKQLATASGLGEASISRYRKGERIPNADSQQIRQLAAGLASLATAHESNTSFSVETPTAGSSHSATTPSDESAASLPVLSEDTILRTLNATVADGLTVSYATYIANLNRVLTTLEINQSDIARSLSYDTSYISRILSGQRRITNISEFTADITSFIAHHPEAERYRTSLAALFECSSSALRNAHALTEQLTHYLCNHSEAAAILPIQSFLEKMNDFNLDEYIDAIHFNDIKVPTMPIQMPVSRYYYGIEDMRKAELDFFKNTVTGKAAEPIFMYSNMPMEELAEDMDFNKKWMFGIAASLRKGLHINIIHNLDRPFSELMLGLEAWIPIYMTGQVSPYYLPDYKQEAFHELNYCSGSAILHGECIHGHYADGRYYLSNSKSDLTYYRTRTNDLLRCAEPLMDIYGKEHAKEADGFIRTHLNKKADWHILDANLPVITIPESLLEEMTASLSEQDRKRILNYCADLKVTAEELLATNHIYCSHAPLSPEEFESADLALMFPDLFMDIRIPYTYDQYQTHYQAAQDFAASHANFVLDTSQPVPFKNIRIITVSGHYFIVSKCKSPVIHFVVKHPILLHAMENFHVAKWE